MSIRGTIITKIPLPDVPGASRSAKREAAREVADQLLGHIARHSSRAYPPASGPGQYPKERTGEFVAGVNVTGTENYVTIATEAPHGVYLQWGTERMAPRPWATKAWKSKDWTGKYKQLARGK